MERNSSPGLVSDTDLEAIERAFDTDWAVGSHMNPLVLALVREVRSTRSVTSGGAGLGARSGADLVIDFDRTGDRSSIHIAGCGDVSDPSPLGACASVADVTTRVRELGTLWEYWAESEIEALLAPCARKAVR